MPNNISLPFGENPCYEIEIRGPLSFSCRESLECTLVDRGALLHGDHERESYIFQIKDGCLDLRVRTTDKGAELVLKYGLEPHATVRWKHTLPLGHSVHLDEAVNFLAYYGFNEGTVVKRRYKTYIYQGRYKFVLAEVPGFGEYNYFEIEATTNSLSRTGALAKDLLCLARELRLEVFSKRAYARYLQRLSSRAVDKRFTSEGTNPAFGCFPTLGLPLAKTD
jgi:adenylate cyclase class IV